MQLYNNMHTVTYQLSLTEAPVAVATWQPSQQRAKQNTTKTVMPEKEFPHVIFEYAYALEGALSGLTGDDMEDHNPVIPWVKPSDGLCHGLWNLLGIKNTEKLIEGMATQFRKFIDGSHALYVQDNGFTNGYDKLVYMGSLSLAKRFTNGGFPFYMASSPGIALMVRQKPGVVMGIQVCHTSAKNTDIVISTMSGQETKFNSLSSVTLMDLVVYVKSTKQLSKQVSLQFVRSSAKVPLIPLQDYRKSLKTLFPPPSQMLLGKWFKPIDRAEGSAKAAPKRVRIVKVTEIRKAKTLPEFQSLIVKPPPSQMLLGKWLKPIDRAEGSAKAVPKRVRIVKVMGIRKAKTLVAEIRKAVTEIQKAEIRKAKTLVSVRVTATGQSDSD